MAYSAGDVILDDEYNTFATGNAAGTGDTSVAAINTIWGTGTGDKGMGQSNTVAAVSAGSSVTATQWTTLLARLDSIRQHQNTTINISDFNVAAGETIAVIANLATDITTLYNASGTGASANITESSTAHNFTASWNSTVTATSTVTFAGGNEARFFFNAGGYIKLNPSLSDSTGRNAQWAHLLDEVGDLKLLSSTFTRTFSNNSSGYGAGGDNSPTTHLSTTGYYDLSNSTDTVMFKYTIDDAFGYGNYRANYYEVKMNPGADHGDGLGNNGEVITVKQIFADDHSNSQDTSVTGDIAAPITVGKPNTNQLNNDAVGTVTVSNTSFTAS
mgnify:CR=1 FL=1|tara:strand:- start:1202 stop:2191 length:990 start_codon:yes stop_codon:yes gene_type:complete